MAQQTDKNLKIRKERAWQAIGHAMENSWEAAASANREILDLFPEDVEALNRLGKALSELGCYSEAAQAFNKALQASPHNSIAKKNLDRISLLGEDEPKGTPRQGVPPHFFIAETGKTRVTHLLDMAPKEVLAKVAAGEPVLLEPEEHKLIAKNVLGEKLGIIEPKIGLRLLHLMRGGNRYEAATTSLSNDEIRVISKESYQHPSQAGRLSFPPKGHDDFRPYMWEGISRYGADDDGEAGTDFVAEQLLEDGAVEPDDMALLRRSPSQRRRESRPAEEEGL